MHFLMTGQNRFCSSNLGSSRTKLVLFLSIQNQGVGGGHIIWFLLLSLVIQSMLKTNLGVLCVTNEHVQWRSQICKLMVKF